LYAVRFFLNYLVFDCGMSVLLIKYDDDDEEDEGDRCDSEKHFDLPEHT